MFLLHGSIDFHTVTGALSIDSQKRTVSLFQFSENSLHPE